MRTCLKWVEWLVWTFFGHAFVHWSSAAKACGEKRVSSAVAGYVCLRSVLSLGRRVKCGRATHATTRESPYVSLKPSIHYRLGCVQFTASQLHLILHMVFKGRKRWRTCGSVTPGYLCKHMSMYGCWLFDYVQTLVDIAVLGKYNLYKVHSDIL